MSENEQIQSNKVEMIKAVEEPEENVPEVDAVEAIVEASKEVVEIPIVALVNAGSNVPMLGNAPSSDIQCQDSQIMTVDVIHENIVPPDTGSDVPLPEGILFSDFHCEDPQIRIVDLCKEYRNDRFNTVTIQNFTLDIRRGETISVIGPSGCGKTTILRMIAGLIEPTSGAIYIDGNLCDKPGPDRGMVFQDFALFPWRTVKKNVEFGIEVTGVSKKERSDRADKYLDVVGLGDFKNAKIHELSGGMKQRVGIARALVNKPAVLLMDEPFGALDAQTRNIMQVELLKMLDKNDQTVVFVTHSVDEAVFLSDRIVILTKRPARIKEILEISWPHPRDRADPDFTKLRKRILEELEKENVMD